MEESALQEGVLERFAAENQPQKTSFLEKRDSICTVCRFVKPVEPPEETLVVKIYGNVDFVNIMVKKSFNEQLEEKAKRQETKPDVLIYNALLMLEKLKRDKSAKPRNINGPLCYC